jgi:hypothetical protein
LGPVGSNSENGATTNDVAALKQSKDEYISKVQEDKVSKPVEKPKEVKK